MITENKAIIFDLMQQISRESYNMDLTDADVVEQINKLTHSDALTESDLSTLEDAASIMDQLFRDLCEYNNN